MNALVGFFGQPVRKGNVTARETEIENMRDAFTLWEEEFRADPSGFMDDATMRAKTPGDLGEVRALYFADLLDKVRDRKANAASEGRP